MAVLRKQNIILLPFVAVSILLLGQPSFSQTTISEQTLTRDMIIEEMYQPGSGLPVGKIQSVRGEAIVFHRDPSVGYRIQTGLPLYAGDIVRTRETGWMFGRLIDGSHIFLSPKTTLTILQGSYNASRKKSVAVLYLKHGSARFKLNPMADLSFSDYRVQTAVAVTRARQGDFVIQASSKTAEIAALENSRLEVISTAQPEEITFLSDFQKTTVSDAILFPTVETLSKEDVEIMKANFQTALSGSLATAGTKKEGADLKIEDNLIEEDIVED